MIHNNCGENFYDITFSLDLLDVLDYGTRNGRGSRYISELTDSFSKGGREIPF